LPKKLGTVASFIIPISDFEQGNVNVTWAAILLSMLTGDVVVQRDGPALVTWSAPSTSNEGLVLRFHEKVDVTISIVGAESVDDVRTPEKLLKTPGWREEGRGKATVEKTPDGKTVWRQLVTFVPLAPVDSVVQLEPVKYRIGDGDWRSATTAPVAVHILPTSTDDAPRDITGPLGMRSAVPDRLDWRLPTLVVVALGLVALVFVVRRRQRRAATPARVLEELRRLEALGLCDKGKLERHCTLLAGILRRYLDRRYGLPARRRTTEETLAAARRMPELAGDTEFLTTFLTACDNAKFAPVEAAPAEGRRLTSMLREWLASPAA
jgi:hypothetical protein